MEVTFEKLRLRATAWSLLTAEVYSCWYDSYGLLETISRKAQVPFFCLGPNPAVFWGTKGGYSILLSSVSDRVSLFGILNETKYEQTYLT